jgi:hypothetical protein
MSKGLATDLVERFKPQAIIETIPWKQHYLSLKGNHVTPDNMVRSQW